MKVIMSQYKENRLIFPSLCSVTATSRYEKHFPIAGNPCESALWVPLEITPRNHACRMKNGNSTPV
jgi:hypothetical protein